MIRKYLKFEKELMLRLRYILNINVISSLFSYIIINRLKIINNSQNLIPKVQKFFLTF